MLSLESLQIRRNHNWLKSLSFFFSQPLRGALAIVTDVERDAVDADGALTNALEADGKGVWS